MIENYNEIKKSLNQLNKFNESLFKEILKINKNSKKSKRTLLLFQKKLSEYNFSNIKEEEIILIRNIIDEILKISITLNEKFDLEIKIKKGLESKTKILNNYINELYQFKEININLIKLSKDILEIISNKKILNININEIEILTIEENFNKFFYYYYQLTKKIKKIIEIKNKLDEENQINIKFYINFENKKYFNKEFNKVLHEYIITELNNLIKLKIEIINKLEENQLNFNILEGKSIKKVQYYPKAGMMLVKIYNNKYRNRTPFFLKRENKNINIYFVTFYDTATHDKGTTGKKIGRYHDFEEGLGIIENRKKFEKNYYDKKYKELKFSKENY